ncbi:Extracellular membrane protein CFEM domain [Penicillium robsamsonii]|uniref:Extracellular membrane protein CFEM domain n=1 Tax=Penicillium robsamsonii TaxID=1792511 RepID=UPI002549A9D7|nr:Extracellular membrane protein CFEM domain [Penicillium robsamsonii]KAJ5813084.1 Extracellular membrane protein CFEM domain [Penicillium robsamsonii]
MKFSTTLIAFVAAGLASAQLPDVPSCSLSCFLSALQSDGCSELLDFKCHCKKTELVSSITPCVEKACEYKDRISVSNAVVNQCSSAGEPISIPPIETGAETTTAAESTKTPTVPEPTTAKPTESASSSEGESSTTSAAGTTTAAGTPIGSSSGVASSTPLVTKTGAAPSSSSPAFNGAGSVKGNMAGVAALAAAAAYVL